MSERFPDLAKQVFSFLEGAGFRLTQINAGQLRYESAQSVVDIGWDARSGELEAFLGLHPQTGLANNNCQRVNCSPSGMIEGKTMQWRAKTCALCACLLVLYATGAHASGDPIVIYLTAGAGLVQLALLIFLLVAQAFRVARLPAVAAYLLYLVVLWSWVWQSRQSSTLLGIGLTVLPCLAVAVLIWMLSTAASRNGDRP